MTNRATIIAPSETEAGSAGRQPCRGITWRVGQNIDRQRGNRRSALPSILISLIDPNALKIPAPKGRNFYLTESARTPFSAEPEQKLRHGSISATSRTAVTFLTLIAGFSF